MRSMIAHLSVNACVPTCAKALKGDLVRKWVIRGSLFLAGCAISGHAMAVEADYLKTLQAVAQDIAGLKSEFPQLKEFSPTTNVNPHGTGGPLWPVIDYKYHTHRAKQSGGWTSGVPNPDDDGIWFWIDFHEPDSHAQIDTQPMVGPGLCLDEKRVQFLILEGKKTKSIDSRILSILQKHGVARCGQLQNETKPK
jgi:hypothetical protein